MRGHSEGLVKHERPDEPGVSGASSLCFPWLTGAVFSLTLPRLASLVGAICPHRPATAMIWLLPWLPFSALAIRRSSASLVRVPSP